MRGWNPDSGGPARSCIRTETAPAASKPSSDRGDTVGSFCGAVDGFDEGDAATALEAVAGGGAVVLGGLGESFEGGLGGGKMTYEGGVGSLVFGAVCGV